MKNSPITDMVLVDGIYQEEKLSPEVESSKSPLQYLKNKYVALILGASLVTACGPDPIEDLDTEKPKVALSDIKAVDNDGDGVKNDLTGTITATDNESVAGKRVTAGGVEGYVNGNTFTVTNVPFGLQTVVGYAEDPSGNEGKITDSVKITAPDAINTAPVIQSFVVNAVDKYTQIGDVVGTIEARDDEADDLTYTLNDGDDIEENDKFYLDGNLVKAKVLFGQEPLHQQHPLTATVSDGEFGDEQSVTVDEIGGNGDPETFVQPDIEVQRSIHPGSYTFNPTYLRDGVAAITKTELADNDPNTAEYKYDIVNGVDGTTRADLAEVEAAIEATGLGDATALNLAPGIVDGYGIAGFRETTNEEREANNASYLVNERGEFVSGPGFKKVIQFFKEKFGLTGSADFKNDPKGDRNKQNARACVVMQAMFMTQTGADESETVQKWGAITHQIITSMTSAELEEFMRQTHNDWYFEANGGWYNN